MSAFLQCPVKKTQAVDLVKPLSNYIKNTFSSEVLNDNKDLLAEFNQLRGNAVVKSLDKHETSLETLQRYYDQLMVMEAKLPITEDQIRVSFTWYDTFDKGSIFGSTKCSLISGGYERFCVLFNIAALMSQIAYTQNLTTDDGLKTAAKYYQQAAGIFAHLKDNVYPALQLLPTPDLSVTCLSALSSIMLAQAQDCFYQKASTDKMKDATVAKVAMQAADFYQEAARSANNYEIKSLWEKDWIPILSCKQSFFTAAAEYHQSCANEAASQYGERVARLQKASKHIQDAVKTGSALAPSNVKTMSKNVSQNLEQAKKDNDFIYLDKVPSTDQLSGIGRAAIAKPTAVNTPLTSNFQDLFTKLVPMAVHQAMSSYDGAKANIVNGEVGKLREATQFLNGMLASMNLPAAIEDLSGAKVPQSVIEKSEELKSRGGLAIIDQMMQNLPDLLTRNREVLDEAFRMMDEEEEDDEKMRAHFKDRWTRTQSKQLTAQLKQEGSKYKAILDNANSADGIVKSKYNEHRRSLEILSKTESEIAELLPRGSSSAGDGGAVQELRNYMQQVESLKKEREELEGEFKSATVDMQSKFMQALAAEGYLDGERIIGQNIEEVYSGLRQSVEESSEKQNTLLEDIKASNDRFTSEKQGENPRDKMLKDLASAYDAFIELQSNLEEGTKFYNDLTNLLLKYQGKVNDLVFARKTEKDEHSRELQQQAAKGTSAPTPSVPSHHSQPKPERPPPPQQQNYQQQQQGYQQQQQPVPAPRPAPRQQPGSASAPPPAQAPQQPAYQSPYPQQPMYMPQPGYFAPPGGMSPYPGGYQPNYGAYQQPQQGGYQPYPQQPGQYVPPYAQQSIGYQGYQQQPPPQQ